MAWRVHITARLPPDLVKKIDRLKIGGKSDVTRTKKIEKLLELAFKTLEQRKRRSAADR